jgi:hypothetical protein
MAEMWKPQDNHIEVTELLSRVRSMITAAGCSDRMDAERWLMSWPDTPNDALGGVEPRLLLEKVDNKSARR